MNCCPAFEELSALIDGGLSPARELEIRWHLDICRACVRYADAVVALKGAIGRAHNRDLPLPALRRSVRARLPKRRRGWQWRARAVAAPLLVASSAMLFCVAESAACEVSMGRDCGNVHSVRRECLRTEELLSVTKPS